MKISVLLKSHEIHIACNHALTIYNEKVLNGRCGFSRTGLVHRAPEGARAEADS